MSTRSCVEMSAWPARVKGIVDAVGKVDWAQIYTTARKTSDDTVLPIDQDFLQGIADFLTNALGIDAKIRIMVSIYEDNFCKD